MKLSLTKIIQILLLGVLLVGVLVYASQVLKPIALAIMLSMLMAPLCSWLDNKGMPRTFSSLICVLILLICITGVLTIVTAQFMNFSEDMPLIEKRANSILVQGQTMIKEKFNISPNEQILFLKTQLSNAKDSMGKYAGNILGGITGTIATIILMLVFTYLLLFNKEKYETFFLRLYKDEDAEKVRKELSEITKISQSYLTGRAISMTLQAIIFSVGLLIIGIKSAILLGCLAALLTILPYVGTVTGGLFPIFMSLITEDSINPTIWVIVLLVGVQTLDNYFIEPNVVGGKVHLNALFTILIILIGGLIWGAVGMILFTPMLGIVKIVFDHIEGLKPYAYLIGDDEKKFDPNSLGSRIKAKLRFKKG
ncbi:MAG: AI-2E family transporter [Opitutaceae bacterium]|nr:AI-2E family transporter [Cytophagales bacterium]